MKFDIIQCDRCHKQIQPEKGRDRTWKRIEVTAVHGPSIREIYDLCGECWIQIGALNSGTDGRKRRWNDKPDIAHTVKQLSDIGREGQ